MATQLLVKGRGTVAEVARYLYGESFVVDGDTDADGNVWAVVELHGVEAQVQIDRYASGLFAARRLSGVQA